MDNKLTHFDNSGNARMVDVSEKNETARVAVAVSKIKVSRETLELIENGKIGKGDVLGVARIAGIMASKQTSNLIPMCHPLMITSCNVDFEINKEEIEEVSLVEEIYNEGGEAIDGCPHPGMMCKVKVPYKVEKNSFIRKELI